MSLNAANISAALVTMTVNEAVVSPLTETLSVKVPLTFANVTNLKVLKGTYAPANDQLTLLSGLTNTTDPTFIFLLVDSPANLSMVGNQGTIQYESITKVALKTIQNSAGYFLQTVTLDGRTTAAIPMAQGQPVNYTLITCQGTVS